MPQRRRIAILGGGVGGVVTAFALSSTEELRDRFEITLYQRGWRLGGKGASGRNLALGARIEEHGLHIWFGYYDNAFRLMRECYEELGRPAGAPLATIDDAFKPGSTVVLFDRQGAGWESVSRTSREHPLKPGGHHEFPTFWQLTAIALRWARREFEAAGPHEHAPKCHLPEWAHRLAEELGHPLRELLHGWEHVIELALRLAVATEHTSEHEGLMCRLLEDLRHFAWVDFAEPRVATDMPARFFFTSLDAVVTGLIGMLRDGVLDDGFAAIDDYELSEWLMRHGATALTIGASPETRAPLLRSLYDLTFAFDEGRVSQPLLSAAVGVHMAIRMLCTYKGAMFYKMCAGMGDAVFAPYYEVLRRRGVDIRFFHWVTGLDASPDGEHIDEISLTRQARPSAGDYQPLVDVAGLPCWPNEPCWDQLVDGDALRDRGADFDAAPVLDAGAENGDAIVLHRGRDFDDVVLAIPLGALGPICRSLVAGSRNPRLAGAIASVKTVATQAFQLWMREEVGALGWKAGTYALSGSYVEPLDTYSDMSQVLPTETGPPAAGVKSVAYVCGVLADAECGTVTDTTARVREHASEFVRHDASPLWPLVCGPDGQLRWDVLFDPHDGVGEARLAAQFFRANVDSSERYVLSPPGTSSARLPADGSGYDNLFVAGDWTQNVLNVGCVEAATISGLQAARAISGEAFPIVGADDAWIRRR